MEKKIITISREFGSGGRELGKRLAEALDVLAEEAETRQVILFTCQSREAKLVGTEKLETAL